MINGEHIPFASANLDHTEMSQDQLIRSVRTCICDLKFLKASESRLRLHPIF